MKQGDQQVVSIGGIPVGQAVVERVEGNQVTLVIPAQRVVMGLRTELTPGDDAPKDTSGTETIIEGADRSATVGETSTTSATSTSSVSETPVVETVVAEQVQPIEPLPMFEDNTPEAIEADSAPSGTTEPVEQKKIESPVTITSADGRSYTLPPGTTMDDLMEPAANE